MRVGMNADAPKTVLEVTCPHCGKAFASAIQMDAATWEDITMNDAMIERCSHRLHSSRFTKGDYFFESNALGTQESRRYRSSLRFVEARGERFCSRVVPMAARGRRRSPRLASRRARAG